MVIWIIGLSGAGKTTIGRALWTYWKESELNTVLIDGDEIRELFNDMNGANSHTIEGRRQNAERIYRICEWLDRQGINVVCSILSIFPDLRARNKEAFSQYFEVFVDCPLEILRERDSKGLYAGSQKGEIRNVVGVDIPFPRPKEANLIIDNSTHGLDAMKVAKEILHLSRSIS